MIRRALYSEGSVQSAVVIGLKQINTIGCV